MFCNFSKHNRHFSPPSQGISGFYYGIRWTILGERGKTIGRRAPPDLQNSFKMFSRKKKPPRPQEGKKKNDLSNLVLYIALLVSLGCLHGHKLVERLVWI